MTWKRIANGQLALGIESLVESASLPTPEQRLADAYPEMAPMVQRHLRLLLRNTQEAEDLTHEAFLRLFEQLRQGKDPDDWRSWLLKVGRNLAIDRLRKKSAGELGDDLLWTLAAPADDDLIASERLRQVHKALALLAPQERICLELRAEGLTYKEIAANVEVSISTVQTALERAIRKLARVVHD